MARIAGIDLPKKQKRRDRTTVHLRYWTFYSSVHLKQSKH